MRLNGKEGHATDFLLPLCPFVLFLALHLPLLWRQKFFIYQDTLQLFQLFHIAYSNLLLHGSMAEWAPYSNYGIPAYLKDIIGFSPFSYLVLAAGTLLRVTDSWPLFLVSLAIEVLVFTVGFHGFCRLFLTRFASSLVAGTAFLLTSPLWWNYQYHFRVVYLLPAATWLLVKFFRAGHVSMLALGGTLILLSGFGEPHYHVALFAFYGATTTIAFALAYRRGFRPVLDAAAGVTIPLAGVFATATIYIFLTSIEDLTFVSRGRDPETLRVSLSAFLTYGEGGIVKLLELVSAAPVNTPDVFFHITAPGLALAAYASLRERSRDFLAIAGAFAVLLIFCLGPYSPIAVALYFVPGMSFVRHVGLMYAFPRMLLAVMAGFGADRFLANLAEGSKHGTVALARLQVAIISALFGGACAVVLVILEYRGIDLMMGGASLLAFLGLAAAAMFAPVRSMRPVLAALIVAEAAVYLTAFAISAGQRGGVDARVGLVTARAFEEGRPVRVEDHSRIGLMLNLSARGVRYADVSSFFEIDSCTPFGRVEAFAKSIGDLARARFGSAAALRDIGALHEERPDDPFFRVLACGSAKLQLVQSLAERRLGEAEAPPGKLGGETTLLESSGGERLVVSGHRRRSAATLAEQGMEVSDHSANHVTVRLAPAIPGGAWLIYADAYHPSWRAEVDGAPVPIWRANVAVKAVRLPPGAHTVTFRFGDRLRNLIVWIVGLGGAGLIVAVLVACARDRRR